MDQPLNPELDVYLHKFLDRVKDLQAALVCDREGVVLAKACKPGLERSRSLSSTFSTASDQASKCGLGKCKTMVTFYKEKTIVYIQHLPLVISFIGGKDLNVGLLLAVQDELRHSLDPLQVAVKTAEADL